MCPETKGQTVSLAVQRCCLQGRLRRMQLRVLWTDGQSLGNKVKRTQKGNSGWRQQFQSCATREPVGP